MELQAGGLPIQSQELNQTTALSIEVSDQCLVLDLQQVQRQHVAPVPTKPERLSRPYSAISQIAGEQISMRIELKEI
jgi:hypothetical protein